MQVIEQTTAEVPLPLPDLKSAGRGWVGRVKIVTLMVAGTGLITAAVAGEPLITPVRLVLAVAGLGCGFRLLTLGLRRRFGQAVRPGVVLSAVWMGGLTVVAFGANFLPLAEGRDPSKTLAVANLQGPSLLSNHPLGTDTLGLDVLAQLVYGARVSLTVALGASLIALFAGTVLGMISGYVRGAVDNVIGFFTDVILSFPALILLLAMATFLKPSLTNVTVALGVLALPGYVRLARANTLAISSRDFVTASRTLGAGPARIIRRNLLPNVLPSLLAYSLIVMSFLIVAEASLSYLGLGIQRPNPTWGNLIAQGQTYLQTNPSLVAIPSIALFLTVTSANYLGQWLQSKKGLL